MLPVELQLKLDGPGTRPGELQLKTEGLDKLPIEVNLIPEGLAMLPVELMLNAAGTSRGSTSHSRFIDGDMNRPRRCSARARRCGLRSSKLDATTPAA